MSGRGCMPLSNSFRVYSNLVLKYLARRFPSPPRSPRDLVLHFSCLGVVASSIWEMDRLKPDHLSSHPSGHAPGMNIQAHGLAWPAALMEWPGEQGVSPCPRQPTFLHFLPGASIAG